MSNELKLQPVLAAYPVDFQPTSISSLGSAGGFSGAVFWRLEAPVGQLCLRKWPREHPGRERLRFIHEVLENAAQSGFHLAPVPIKTGDGKTCVEHGGHCWELTFWMPGAADYQQLPSRQRLRAALSTLAEFHKAATLPSSEGVSPGISERCEFLKKLVDRGSQAIGKAIHGGQHDWPGLAQQGCRLLPLFDVVAVGIGSTLQRCHQYRVRLQPCLRDVWHDHILFTGDNVTGIVDCGAMRMDNVATDIARLLGSFAGDDPHQWQHGLDTYQQARQLTELEFDLVKAFDQSTVTLAGMNWLHWVFIDGRRFGHREVIEARVDEFITRLEHLASA